MNIKPLTAAVIAGIAGTVGIAAQASPRNRDDHPTIVPVMRLQAAAAGEYELLVYGDIGESWWGESVSARDVVEQLNALDASTTQINVRINSFGGSVADGLAIYNALKRAKANKVVTVDGVAMSSASLIAMAGDEIVMGDASMMMIHAPWGGAMGNAKDMRTFADVLDTFAEAMTGAYVAKSGKPRADVLALLTDGTDHYYTGEQAVAEGFADRLVTIADTAPTEQARAMSAGLLQRHLTRAPENIAQLAIAASMRGKVPASTDANQPASPETTGDDVMSFLARQRKRLMNPATGNDGGGGSAANAAGNPNPATNPPAVNAAAANTVVDAHTQAIVALGARNDRIHAALKDVMGSPGVRDLYEQALRDPTMSVEAVQARALTVLGAQSTPANGGGGRVEGGEDQRDKFILGAGRALEARAGFSQRETGNEFNGMTIAQMAAESLARSGHSPKGMSPDQIARKVLAHSTSDFPILLSTVAGKQLRKAYEAHPNTYQLWCAVGQVSDFKANPRIQLGSFNSLATIAEGGEYTYGSLGEESESITATTKGKALKFTRQMVVNDDLGGFLRRAMLMGRAAARTVNNDVYALLTSGASNNGPTMSDAGQLFNATAQTTAGGHGNYLSAGYAPTVASVSAGRAVMRKQKDKSLAETLNIQPKFLLAPTALEDTAWALLNSTADPASANSNKRNYVRDVANLELITDPYLDTISATAWYLAADPMDAPLIEVDFLDGQQTPFVDEQIDFMSDSIDFKVRLDYGIAAIDWRGGYRTSGTGGS
jgi:ATP-dependent protease ClpP protease subunit/phage major head subunit gpT-like protein